MSDDLISRKTLIDEISYKFGLGDSIISNVISIIKRHKTAYDVDKVIKLLEEKAEVSRECWKNFDDESAFGEMNAYSTALNIVKSGGVADE